MARQAKSGSVMLPTRTAALASATAALADALSRAPVLRGSLHQANAHRSVSDNTGGNFLQLRGLGGVRNPILFAGQHVAVVSSVGTVDVTLLPQMLIQHVAVVTGESKRITNTDS